MAWLWSWIRHGPLIICLWLCARMDYAHAWTSAPVLKVWLHAHSCHLALALLVAISILYMRADQTLGGARHNATHFNTTLREGTGQFVCFQAPVYVNALSASHSTI
jgi:hypothetical protein